MASSVSDCHIVADSMSLIYAICLYKQGWLNPEHKDSLTGTIHEDGTFRFLPFTRAAAMIQVRISETAALVSQICSAIDPFMNNPG
jgi:hypothetical protein